MDSPFIACRLSLANASELIDRFGESAAVEAAIRAKRSRDEGNLARYCHWRQIERVVAVLASREIRGTIH